MNLRMPRRRTSSSMRCVSRTKHSGFAVVEFPRRSTRYGKETIARINSVMYMFRQEEECPIPV
jgi:hypothetical protein